MELIAFLGLIGVLALLWARIFRPTDSTARGLGRVLGFWGRAGEGWPRGVQEEDPGRRWGAGRPPPRPRSRPSATPEPEPAPEPALSVVKPAVHRR